MTDQRATTRIDKEKNYMYNQIMTDENSIFHNHSKTDIYVMSAALGYFFKEYKEIPPPNKMDLFLTTTLGAGSERKLWILKSLAISRSGIEILRNIGDVIKICDAYANAGIEHLYNIHITSDNEADDIALLMDDSLERLIE